VAILVFMWMVVGKGKLGGLNDVGWFKQEAVKMASAPNEPLEVPAGSASRLVGPLLDREPQNLTPPPQSSIWN